MSTKLTLIVPSALRVDRDLAELRQLVEQLVALVEQVVRDVAGGDERLIVSLSSAISVAIWATRRRVAGLAGRARSAYSA